MADDVDALLGIAEIAGVFVGFAALVTVVARGSGDQFRDERVFTLAHIVILSVMIIAAALLPVVLVRYGLPKPTVWRVSSGFLYAVNLLQILILNRWTVGYATAFSRKQALSLTILSLSPFFHIPLLLCIFGVLQDLAPAFFLTAIVATMFQVTLFFAYFVIRMLAPEESA